jgi:hypothetical protein
MEKVGIFFGHLEYIMDIWYILWLFGNLEGIWYISPVLVYCVKKNLATLRTSTTYVLEWFGGHTFLSFPPQWGVFFPSSHYNYNYKLQFFDFRCWWLSSSSPE